MKTVSGIMLTLILVSMLTLAFNVQPVEASGTIYIRADGSIDPPTAPTQRDGDFAAVSLRMEMSPAKSLFFLN